MSKPAPNGSRAYAYLDALGRTLKTSTLGFGEYDIVTETQYDNNAQVYSTTVPYQSGSSVTYQTINTYDDLNRIIKVTYPDSSVDERFYDGYDTSERVMVTRIENDKNQTKTEYKNALGELVKVKDNGDNLLTYDFDAMSNLLQVELNTVVQSRIQYDSLGRKGFVEQAHLQ